MTVFDLIDDGAQFTAQLLSEPHAEELRDPVGRQSPKADLAAALEDLMYSESSVFWERSLRIRLQYHG